MIPIVLDYILHLKSDIVLPKADIDLLMMSLNPMVEEVISGIACLNLNNLICARELDPMKVKNVVVVLV